MNFPHQAVESTKRLTPAHVSLKAWLPNSKYLHVCKVKTKEAKNRGEFSVATKDVKQGEIVLKEEPFIRQLNRDLYLTNCYYCFKSVTDIPFTLCRVKACEWKIKYCSQACEEKGWSTCHSWLCRFPELDMPENQDVLFAFSGYIVSRSKGSCKFSYL